MKTLIKNIDKTTAAGLTLVVLFIAPLIIALAIKLSTNPVTHF
jgi:hypothetical protein